VERHVDLTAVLFDFDGTLFDLDLDLRAWRAEAGDVEPGSTVVVSRNFHATVDAGLKKIGFRDPVTVIGREDVARQKPDPEGVATALSRLGTPASGTLLVGDTFHDVEAGHRGGVRVVIVANPRLQFAPTGADAYMASLAELTESLVPA
jgi:phosphoglycolate phosphatase-like HAD superfamily hydrolase